VVLLRQRGLQYGLVDLGGDVAAFGPRPDGSPWPVGIADPDHPQQACAELPLATGAIATSGDYQRYFIANGRRYCHILNPHSGYPVQGIASVSVCAELCIVAGCLTTIAMLKGADEGRLFLDRCGLPYLLRERQGV